MQHWDGIVGFCSSAKAPEATQPVVLVPTSIPVQGSRPGRRRVGHKPRACDALFPDSLLSGCGILKILVRM